MAENKEYEIEEVESNYNNKDYMLNAINNGATWVIAYASEDIHADKSIMTKAIEQDGQMLYYASENLRDNKDFVMKAVQNKWLIVKYASKRLRSDIDIFKAVLENDKKKKSLIYFDEEFLKTPEVQELLKEDEEKIN